MANDLDSILEKLRDLFAAEYQRGSAEALARVVDVIRQPVNGHGRRMVGQRGRKASGNRARRGAARDLIERVLKENGSATVPEILAAASSADERDVSISAIRFELYRGRKDKRYRGAKGQWSLPKGRIAK